MFFRGSSLGDQKTFILSYLFTGIQKGFVNFAKHSDISSDDIVGVLISSVDRGSTDALFPNIPSCPGVREVSKGGGLEPWDLANPRIVLITHLYQPFPKSHIDSFCPIPRAKLRPSS